MEHYAAKAATDPRMTVQDIIKAEDLLRGFGEIAVRQSDVLFFHSSLKSFGPVDQGADTVIDSALAAVGPEGTVVVPTFVQKVDGERASYRTREHAWNIETSPSDVGYVTEVFRKRPEAVRSDHCCESLAAIGAEAEAAMSGHRYAEGRPSPWNEKSFGHGSPWDWMVDRNSAYLLMGVGFEVCSFFHYNQALWVESKYAGQHDGLMWPGFDFAVMGERLKSAGFVRQTSVGRSIWLCFRVAPCVELVRQVLETEPLLIQLKPLRLYGE